MNGSAKIQALWNDVQFYRGVVWLQMGYPHTIVEHKDICRIKKLHVVLQV